MLVYLKIVPAVAALMVLPVGHVMATDIGGIGVSADVSVGDLGVSADIGIGGSGGNGGTGGHGGGLGLDVSVGLGVGSVGATVGVGGKTGDVDVDVNGRPRTVSLSRERGGAAAVDDLAWLRRMIGMVVVSADHKMLGVLEGVSGGQGRFALTIRVNDRLGIRPETVTIRTKSLPDVSDVMRVGVSLRSFLNQV